MSAVAQSLPALTATPVEVPPLREELTIGEGPRAHDGQPSWTIEDPVRNRFFRIDWLTFEVLQRWSLRDPDLIVRNIAEQTPLHPTLEDLETVLQFLAANQLLKTAGADTSAALADMHRRMQPGVAEWLVHNYLFFRIPLLRPERLLRWLHARVGFLFSEWFWRLTLAVGALGWLLVWRHWDEFTAAWSELANVHGLAGFVAVLIGVKVIHELGHGLVATHFGCRVPTMGMAFLVMTPVAYTDTNDAWKLTDRRARLLIGAAGVLAELALAVWATLAWVLLPGGWMRSAAFILATTTWVKSVLINTSPVMRFDGYYLLSDLLDLPNLHTRAFALTRWQVREWLFALGAEPPEYFRRSLRRGLVALALFIWAYRLIVFTGIAIFVYHYFFKALGIVCFTIEMGWFVLLPILSEVRSWWTLRASIARSARGRRFGLLLAAVLLLVFVPFPRRVRAVGELMPRNEFKVVAPEPARLERIGASDGARVLAGQTVVVLSSDTLRHRLELTQAQEETARAQLQAAEPDAALRSRLPTLRAALSTAEAATREARIALANLTAKAPFPGVLRWNDCDVQAGEWLEKQEPVATVVGDGPWQVLAYIDENDAHLAVPGAPAWFYPDGAGEHAIALRVVSIDRDAARNIAFPMLTTPFGGTVAAKVSDGSLVPDRGQYRVVLAAEDMPPELTTEVRRGRIAIAGRAESVAVRVGRAAGAVLWREAGF